ncbi:MAG: hypothetical protein ACXADY_06750 [Candidatus Hodarchaeales archaeon]|jgi:hypothetical protein
MLSKQELTTWKEEITVVIVVCVGSIIIVISNFFLWSISSIINYSVLLFIIILSYSWLKKEPWMIDQSRQVSSGLTRLRIVESLNEKPARALLPLLAFVFTIAILGSVFSLYLMGSLIFGLAGAGVIVYCALKTRTVDIWSMIIAVVLVLCLILWKFFQTITFFESIVLPEEASFGFLFITSISLLSFFCIILAGLLLVKNTEITRVNLLEKDLSQILKSIGVGFFLAIPWGLVSASNISNNQEIEAYWWQPLMIFTPGINEEIWVRLFIIPIAYLSLISFSNIEERYWGTIIVAAIIQAFLPFLIITWLEFLPYLLRIAFFWGIPLSYLFLRRDFETAFSFHFMTEIIPLILFLLAS